MPLNPIITFLTLNLFDPKSVAKVCFFQLSFLDFILDEQNVYDCIINLDSSIEVEWQLILVLIFHYSTNIFIMTLIRKLVYIGNGRMYQNGFSVASQPCLQGSGVRFPVGETGLSDHFSIYKAF